MTISHRSIFDIDKTTKLYSEKDGVDVKYVCTSSVPGLSGYNHADIFYRETPHKIFGNKYFGLMSTPTTRIMKNLGVYIFNADSVEGMEIEGIENNGLFHYSRSGHDFFTPPGCGFSLDGGRAYSRIVYDGDRPKFSTYEIIEGIMRIKND